MEDGGSGERSLPEPPSSDLTTLRTTPEATSEPESVDGVEGAPATHSDLPIAAEGGHGSFCASVIVFLSGRTSPTDAMREREAWDRLSVGAGEVRPVETETRAWVRPACGRGQTPQHLYHLPPPPPSFPPPPEAGQRGRWCCCCCC